MTNRPTAPARRAEFNAWAEDWLRYQVWIDGCLGLTPSPDRQPYAAFKRPAVSAPLKRIDHDDPMAQPSASKRARRGRVVSATAQVMTLAGGVEFVPDDLPDDL
jgi:hypothetical protein